MPHVQLRGPALSPAHETFPLSPCHGVVPRAPHMLATEPSPQSSLGSVPWPISETRNLIPGKSLSGARGPVHMHFAMILSPGPPLVPKLVRPVGPDSAAGGYHG